MSEDWKWLQEIEESLGDWCEEKRDSYPPNGPKGTTYFKRQYQLICMVKRMYIDLSIIRLATDDLRKIANINRMARESLARCKEGKVE